MARQFDRKLRWSSGHDIRFTSIEFCYSGDASPEAIFASASDEAAIAEVSAEALTMFVEGVGGAGKTDNMLYIIHEVDHPAACKIGYTHKPTERLVGLQCGSWRKLKIAALFCPVSANIEKLERSVHAAASRRGLALRGEWIAATPIEATALIMEFANKKGYLLCGADVRSENMGARVAGLRKAQLAMQRAA